MPPYIEIHREQLVLVFLYGGLVLFGIILALTGRQLFLSTRRKAERVHVERFPDGITEKHEGVPLFLVMLYIGLALWAIVYVVAHGTGALSFAG